jgi:hypothetical protein
VLIAVFALAGLAIPETVADQAGRGWRIQRPGVPREIRGAFTRVAVTGAAVWSVAALFVSVLPSYTTEITGSTNLALLGAIASLMLFASCASQAVVRRRAARTGAQAAGLGLLALGLVGLVLAAPLGMVGVLAAGAVLAGVGHGVGFLAAQHGLNRIAREERRGELNAAFYTTIYLGVSVAVIGVGVLADAASLDTGVVVFAAVTGAASLLVAGWQLAGSHREPRPLSAAWHRDATDD